MRLQIIPSENYKFLRDFYGCRLWKIFTVIREKSFLSGNKRSKVRIAWKEYEIETVHTYPHNHQGQKVVIRIKDTECKILEP